MMNLECADGWRNLGRRKPKRTMAMEHQAFSTSARLIPPANLKPWTPSLLCSMYLPALCDWLPQNVQSEHSPEHSSTKLFIGSEQSGIQENVV